MEILFLIAAVVSVIIGTLIYEDRQYKKTSYYKITKSPYSSIKYDKGKRGEYLIYRRLQHFEGNGGLFLFNVYIPKADNGTTEIDLILICSKGLFVIESKNYSGWIFGNETQRNWTQIFPKGRGRSHKEHFYNPIMQNQAHIKHLRRLIGENVPMWSIIAFSDECTFRDVTVKNSNVNVIQFSKVASVVSQICSQTQNDILTQIEISIIYCRLYPYVQASESLKEQHIKNIRE